MAGAATSSSGDREAAARALRLGRFGQAASLERWMTRAVALAWRGLPGARPNPLVGAVVVKAGRVVGRGWHARWGGPDRKSVV